jgi:hypothetical protein
MLAISLSRYSRYAFGSLTMSDTPGCTILPCVRYEKGLFVGTGSGAGTLLYVDLSGNAKTLWEHLSSLLSSPSPTVVISQSPITRWIATLHDGEFLTAELNVLFLSIMFPTEALIFLFPKKV